MIDARDRIVVGAPGGLGFWAFNTVKMLAQHHRPAALEVRVVDRLADVPALPAGQTGRVLLCHCPTNQILDALEQQDIPVLYLEEPPALVVSYLVRGTGLTPLEAARVASASYVARLVLPGVRRLLVLKREAMMPLPDLLGVLCRHLALDVPESAMANILGHISPAERAVTTIEEAIVAFLPAAHQGALDDPIAAGEVAALSGCVLAPLADDVLRPDPPTVVWPGGLFLKYADLQPNERADTPVDLVGPARLILHGPYLYLPRGRYLAELTISCDAVASDSTFRIEAHAVATCTARLRFRSPRKGTFRGRFVLPHEDVGAEIQVQTIAERGAIEGSLTFHRLTLRPLDETGAPTR